VENSTKERPILFNTEMVRAILEGRKTQTRRVIKDAQCEQYTKWTYKPEVAENASDEHVWLFSDDTEQFGWFDRCPYGKPGDLLWVRETCSISYTKDAVMYFDHGGKLSPDAPEGSESWAREWKTCPSIHMPKWAARIWLRVKDVRVERVQDISMSDAVSEGVPTLKGCPEPRISFMDLWNDINAKRGYGWEVNPWVWVVEFERVERAG